MESHKTKVSDLSLTLCRIEPLGPKGRGFGCPKPAFNFLCFCKRTKAGFAKRILRPLGPKRAWVAHVSEISR